MHDAEAEHRPKADGARRGERQEAPSQTGSPVRPKAVTMRVRKSGRAVEGTGLDREGTTPKRNIGQRPMAPKGRGAGSPESNRLAGSTQSGNNANTEEWPSG